MLSIVLLNVPSPHVLGITVKNSPVAYENGAIKSFITDVKVDIATTSPNEVEVLSNDNTGPNLTEQDDLIHELSLKYGQNEVLVKKIIGCESALYKNAVNVNSNGTIDHGLLQVNSIHTRDMVRLGLNINNWRDSLKYGFIMMKSQGLRPWRASEKCWSN